MDTRDAVSSQDDPLPGDVDNSNTPAETQSSVVRDPPSAPLVAAFLQLLIQLGITLYQYWTSNPSGFAIVRQFGNSFLVHGRSVVEAATMAALLIHVCRSYCGLNFITNDTTFGVALQGEFANSPGKAKLEWCLRVFFIVDQGVYFWALRADHTKFFLLLLALQSAGLVLFQCKFGRALYVDDR